MCGAMYQLNSCSGFAWGTPGSRPSRPDRTKNKTLNGGFRMKKFMWVALAAALFVIPSHAQSVTPAADVSAGYSYLRVGGSNGVNMNGGTGAVTFNANNGWGLAANFGFYTASPPGVGVWPSTFQSGPPISYRAGGKAFPFGGARFAG